VELSYHQFQAFLNEAHPLVHIGLLLLCGYAGGKIANILKAPRVSGYVVAGMILSPSILGIFHEELVGEDLAIITDIALGIIAFSIGGALELAKIKRLGRQIFWITVTQGLGAFLLVTLAIVLFFPFIAGSGSSLLENYVPLAIVIGAISAATAPAATLEVVHEYRSKGPVTTVLLAIVTLDDALTIFFFAFAVQIAGSLMSHQAFSITATIIGPSAEILMSVLIGATGGLFLWKLTPLITNRNVLLGVVLGAIFLTSGLALDFHASPLLANMVLGFAVVNAVRHSEDLFTVVESIEEPIYSMFFVLAGAHLDISMFKTTGWLVLLLIVGRFAGKFLGTWIGAVISGSPESVKKYLGFGLMPQAGVTIGLVLLAREQLGDSQVLGLMVNAVLASVIVNELLSPLMVRYALVKSGEAKRA